MKRLLVLLTVVAMFTAPAFAGSPWWDDRLDGLPVLGYDGNVVYTMAVLNAPISLPLDDRVFFGRVTADPFEFTFTDYFGNEYSGSYHAATGCYLSSEDPGEVIQAFCYDGVSSFFMLYGTLEWNGSHGVIAGPWEFIVKGAAYSGPMFVPRGPAPVR